MRYSTVTAFHIICDLADHRMLYIADPAAGAGYYWGWCVSADTCTGLDKSTGMVGQAVGVMRSLVCVHHPLRCFVTQ
jgi:hypothetical protein